MNMSESNDELLRKNLGISFTDIDYKSLVELVVDSFLYHEGMAELAINAINKKDAEGNQQDNRVLWDSFETNNTLAYSMREILLKASDVPEI
jgi:hypothetical protein